jgi:hypothetical protein
MAITINSNTPNKRTAPESLDLISGSQAVRLVLATETFVGNIHAIVPNEDSTITQLLANDTAGSDVIGSGVNGMNINGATLSLGSYIKPNDYDITPIWTSVTCGTGSLWVYYSNTLTNN